MRAGLRAAIIAVALTLTTCVQQDRPRHDARADADAKVTAARPDAVVAPEPVPELAQDLLCPRAEGSRVGELDWIPADARVVALIELADPELDAALEQLSAALPELDDVPIVSGMALSQLPLQLAVLRPALAQGGFAPASVLLLHTRASEPVWVLRAPCDLDEMRGAIERRWPVKTRAVIGGVVAERDPARGDQALLGDVVFASGDRVAITPPGAGARLLRWLEGQVQPDAGALVGAPDPRAAPEVESLEPAAIRVLLHGQGLLAVGAHGDAEAHSTRVLLRASSAGVERVEVEPPGQGEPPG
ncbi:MAG: hypothetical protein KC468_35770 [Myxococcales bacterium]|nr:hypothetical protein [Myxococcales bacterium]